MFSVRVVQWHVLLEQSVYLVSLRQPTYKIVPYFLATFRAMNSIP